MVFPARERPSACFKCNEMRSGDRGDELVKNELSLGSLFYGQKKKRRTSRAVLGQDEKRRFIFSSL